MHATTVDAVSFGIDVTIVEDACFGRFESSHAMALFDMNAKCGWLRTA